MSATVDQELAELRRAHEELQKEHDAALVELQARNTALAQRNSEYGERIEQQAATIDVLKTMSASPGDALPVFRLIVERARAFCEADSATLALVDDNMLHLQAYVGFLVEQEYAAQFPRPVSSDTMLGRAIITHDTIQVPDVSVDPEHYTKGLGPQCAIIAVPLRRAGMPIGAISIGRSRPGEFSSVEVELLKTFAEQAVIAITSAETFRALQTRTSDLQQSLEYQTATSDVLKVISRSNFDLQPVLDTVVVTAARLCDADMAVIARREGGFLRGAAYYGYSPEYRSWVESLGAVPIDANNTVGYRAAREGRVVHVHDVAADPNYPTELIALGKQRTSLGVPLLRQGETIGMIVLSRQRVEPFIDRQIELVSTFADQAVIAIENARLLNEQREALEQQTATAEVLQIINASPGDLTPVFDAMLDKALDLCGAAFGNLWTYDGEMFHAAAVRRVPAPYADALQRTSALGTRSGTVLGQLAAGSAWTQILDAAAEGAYLDSDARAVIELGHARTIAGVALRKDGALLGAITIYRQEVRPFSDKQITLLQNFAAQAVIAMENARLLTETGEALEQQTATAEVLLVINSSPGNLAPVLDAMLEKAVRLCGAVSGALFTYDGERFHTMATLGVPAAGVEFRTKNPPTAQPGNVVERLLRTRRTIHTLDAMAGEGYLRGEPGPAVPEFGGARTMLDVPLLKDGDVVGFFSVLRREVRAFSEKQISLLENFAAQAVIAMENARLLNEVRQRQEELRITFENMGDGVAMFDGTQHLVAWKAATSFRHRLPGTARQPAARQ
jgi:GAF domain-containing protein